MNHFVISVVCFCSSWTDQSHHGLSVKCNTSHCVSTTVVLWRKLHVRYQSPNQSGWALQSASISTDDVEYAWRHDMRQWPNQQPLGRVEQSFSAPDWSQAPQRWRLIEALQDCGKFVRETVFDKLRCWILHNGLMNVFIDRSPRVFRVIFAVLAAVLTACLNSTVPQPSSTLLTVTTASISRTEEVVFLRCSSRRIRHKCFRG